MGLTKDYLRYQFSGVCNLIGSNNGLVANVDRITCATIAGEAVNFYNMRTLELTRSIKRTGTNISVTTFKINSERSMIVIGFDNGEIDLHRLDQQENFPTKFVGHKIGLNCLAFSPDGLVFASGGKDSSIILWDILAETGLFKLSGHKGTITNLQFTNSRCIISSSKDSQIKFWCLESKACFYTISESTTEIYTFSLLKNDRLLIVGNAEVELLVFELAWLENIDENGLDEFIVPGCSSPKKILAKEKLTGSTFIDEDSDQANKIVRVRKRGSLIRQSKGRALQLFVSTDETLLCCIGSDTLMDIYRVFNDEESQKRFKKKLRKRKQTLENNNELNEQEILHAKNIAKDVTILIMRIGDFRATSKLKWGDFCSSFVSLAEDHREYKFYCLLKSNDICGVSLKIDWINYHVEGNIITSLGQKGHRTDIRTMAISSNGTLFLSASQESAIVWDLATLSPMITLFDKSVKFISASLFVPGERNVILCTMEGSFFLFDLTKNELVEAYNNVHDGAITCATNIPQNIGFITCGVDKKAKIWIYSMNNNETELIIKLTKILELPDEILGVAVSPNAKFIVLALLDNTSRIYYLDTLKFFVSLYGHSLPVYSVDISWDNKLVITGSGDKTVKIWGLDFGDCHRSLFAHDDVVTCVKFCRNTQERLFWSSGKDGKLKQWDGVKFNLVQTINAHTAPIRALSICSSTDALISASNDRSIRLWELTDEIIVLQEETEKVREKEHDQKLIDMEDIIPGESRDMESNFAVIKTLDSIKSTEIVIEAIDIIRNDKLEREHNPKHLPHPLLATYPIGAEHMFVADTLQKTRSSHLEKSLLLVPFGYITDILNALCRCVKEGYIQELACRVILFLLKVYHNQIKNSVEFLYLIDELRITLPSSITKLLDQTGFNLAALKLLQMKIEEKNDIKLFKDISLQEKEKTTAKKKKIRQKAKNFAVVQI